MSNNPIQPNTVGNQRYPVDLEHPSRVYAIATRAAGRLLHFTATRTASTATSTATIARQAAGLPGSSLVRRIRATLLLTGFLLGAPLQAADTPASLAAPMAAAAPSAATPTADTAAPPRFTATVVKVYDGETLAIRRPGSHDAEVVDLIGVDAPRKSTREEAGTEPEGTLAQQYLSLLIARREVTVEIDPAMPERGGRPHVYLWLGDRLLNADMLRAGHARCPALPRSPALRHADALTAAEAEAKTAARGIWQR